MKNFIARLNSDTSPLFYANIFSLLIQYLLLFNRTTKKYDFLGFLRNYFNSFFIRILGTIARISFPKNTFT